MLKGITEITTLDLTGSFLTFEGLEKVLESVEHYSFSHLNLANNGLEAEDLLLLVQYLQNSEQIMEINLSGNELNFADVKQFLKEVDKTSLENIIITTENVLTEEELDEIDELIPDSIHNFSINDEELRGKMRAM